MAQGGAKKVSAVRASAAPACVSRWRFVVAAVVLCLLVVALIWRVLVLQVLPAGDAEHQGHEFLQEQGSARSLRVESIAAYRGVITDRNGEPLAVSTEVTTLWANPKVLALSPEKWGELAKALGWNKPVLIEKLQRYRNKGFIYLERHMPPQDAEKVLALKIPGVYGKHEYKRYYPAGEVAAHVVGITDIDDRGQEGMELAYDAHLKGSEGAKRVLKDLKGRVAKDYGLITAAEPGDDLRLSLDLRLQYLAHQELKAAVKAHDAKSGSIVMLDVQTGEILAMANQPSYNPNDRTRISSSATRNRAVTDQFEPGSPMKALTVMTALESGKYSPGTKIYTAPGYIQIGAKTLKDHINYGTIDVTKVLTKSSQVGVTKMALNLEPESIRDMYFRMGLGQSTGSGFPGERVGELPSYRKWQPIVRANFAFGYGMTVTALQLAQAYAVIASEGNKHPVSLLKLEQEPLQERIIDARIAKQTIAMLETVVQKGGTGTRAALNDYPVAGKTGTVHRVGANGYEEDRYSSVFAGMAPADNPRIAMAIIVNEPNRGEYFGGLVAAPIFSNVAAGALRVLQEPPRKESLKVSDVRRGLNDKVLVKSKRAG